MRDMLIEISHERALEKIDKISKFIVKKHMGPPAILTIESLRPMNFIASQLMHFLAPFAEIIFSIKEYEEFAALIEKQEYVKLLIDRIDELDAEMHRGIRKQKKIIRARKREARKEFFNKLLRKKK